MKSYIKIVVLLLPLLLCNALHSYAESYGDYQGAVYLKNYDGDTIRFNLPGYPPIAGKDIRVRVNGIDTPEIKGKCKKEKYEAQQARDMVADILKGAEKINLKNMKRGKYFRIAADVIVDGENLADVLIEAGMAIKYNGGKKTYKWCD
jgi:endonuclease YncB( thermonuclease family)